MKIVEEKMGARIVSPSRRFPSVFSSCAPFVISIAAALATGATARAESGAVVIEGPFVLKDGTGTIGYVVRRRADDTVDFQACSGPLVPVKLGRLQATNSGCASEPLPGLIVAMAHVSAVASACELHSKAVDEAKAHLTADSAGTVYTINGRTLERSEPDAKSDWKFWKLLPTRMKEVCGKADVMAITTNQNEQWFAVVKRP